MSTLSPTPDASPLGWPRKTLAEELRLQLADEIVRGELAPGAALDETGLARRFQVSRTPVREAIRLLAASGLVEARAHRAALVARPNAQHLAGMFEAMAELEALCAGFAAERMGAPERRTLEDIHEILRTPLIGVIPESEIVLQASNQGTPAISMQGSDVSEAYKDVIRRFLGEERPMRFVEAVKPGLFKRLFGR